MKLSHLMILAAGLGSIFSLTTSSTAQEIDPDGKIVAAAASIEQAARKSTVGYETLAELCDNYGNRLSGTETLEDAIDWAAAKMREFGFTNVHKEPVDVPVWVRNVESAEILSPRHHRLAMLGLGRSVGTPVGGIEAPVVRVRNFEELEALPDSAIEGRIVLFDAPFVNYGETVRYRARGASVAARRGAVAVLVRSVGMDGMRTPHTGALHYAEDAPQIPAAAIAFEDANQIARMVARGDEVTVRLEMGATTLEDRVSHNVMGEIRGSEIPEQIVVVGGHIDSWDVGQGAQDDGVGCMLSIEAVRLIHESGLQPRRTIRVVLWTNEENGLRGGQAYATAHAGEINRHFAAMESDSGNGPVRGFRLDLRPATGDEDTSEEEFDLLRERARKTLEPVSALLAPLGADPVTVGHAGADVGPLAELGVPSLGVAHDMSKYFLIHHTEADTFDRIDLGDMQGNAAAMAILLYGLAEMDASLRP